MPETASRKDPLTSFNFIIKIEGMEGSAGFSEVGGLSNETTIVEYREGDREPRPIKLAGQYKIGNISLKRGYSVNGKDLWEWRKSVIDGRTRRLSGTITLLDESRQPTLVWRFFGAWPSKWAGPAMNAKNNDVAIEEMELAVENLELE